MKRMALVLAAAVVTIGCGDSSTATKKLTVGAPSGGVELKQNESKKFQFTVTRTGFEDDVKLTFEGLPEGVTAEGGTVKKGEKTYDVQFKASESAAVTDKKEASVRGEGPGGLKTDAVKFNVKVTK